MRSIDINILNKVRLIIRQLSFGKICQKKDLTDSEKSKIVSCLREGCSHEIAEIFKRDQQIMKHFQQANRVARNVLKRK